MDEVITRIVEIEKQCSADVEQAEKESAERIEEHQRACEAQKDDKRAQIISTENSRRTRTINEARQKAEDAAANFRQESLRLFADPRLQAKIKSEIITILLEG